MDDELRQRRDRALAGGQRDLARLITAIENDHAGVLDLLDSLEGTGAAHVVGITGPPGSGKSTLVDRLIARFRADGERVAVLLVDPSSPFTGGAVLGDRIRMQAHTTDAEVFIRSLGSRGHQGGLTRTTDRVLHLLRAMPFDRVILETVGVGQTELQVMHLADTVVVVLVPEAGDAIQAMKAGLMEIAHLFAVNKADRPGADRLVLELRQGLERAAPAGPGHPAGAAWAVDVQSLSALQDQGVGALLDRIAAHRRHLAAHPAAARPAVDGVRVLVEEGLLRRLRARLAEGDVPGPLVALVDDVAAGRITVYRAAARILEEPALLRAALGLDDRG